MSLEMEEGQPAIEPPVMAIQRPGTVRLDMVLDFAIQKTYTDLQRLTELLPNKTDIDKKIAIAEYLNTTRQLFTRLCALIRYANKSSDVASCQDILMLLDEQQFFLIDTANALMHMSREILVNSRLPNFALVFAVDVFVRKSYIRLPTCLKDKIVPPAHCYPKSEWLDALSELDTVILSRLGASRFPSQLRLVQVKNGHATLIVSGEFKIILTVMSDDPLFPWRLLGIELLVRDPEIVSKTTTMYPHQSLYIQQRVQSRIMERTFDKRSPLVHIYDMLHSFALSLQLDVLHSQLTRLIQSQYGSLLSIDRYQPNAYITLSYWKELSRVSGASRLGQSYSMTVYIDHTESGASLIRLKHVPDMSPNEKQMIGLVITKDNLSMKKLIARTINVRSQHLLETLRNELLLLSPSLLRLVLSPPYRLFVPLLSPSTAQETLCFTVDPFHGTFTILLPAINEALQRFKNSSTPSQALASLHQLVNREAPESSSEVRLSRRLQFTECFCKLRRWLGSLRVRRTVQLHPSPVVIENTLPLWVDATGDNLTTEIQNLLKQNPDALILSSLPQFKSYIVVLPESSHMLLSYRLYAVMARSCDFKGQPTTEERGSALVKPVLIRQLVPNSNRLKTPGSIVTSDLTKTSSKSDNTSKPTKRLATENILSLLRSIASESSANESDAKRPRYDVSLVSIGDKKEQSSAFNIDEMDIMPNFLGIIQRFEASVWISALLWELSDVDIQYECNKDLLFNRSINSVKIIQIPGPPKEWTSGMKALKDRLLGCSISVRRSSSPRYLAVVWEVSDGDAVEDLYHVTRGNDLKLTAQGIVEGWTSMCVMQQIGNALEAESKDLVNVSILNLDLKTIIFSYGTKGNYLCEVRYSAAKGFSLLLTASRDALANPHNLISEHLLKVLHQTNSISRLIKVMLETFNFVMAVNQLSDPVLALRSEKLNSPGTLVRNISLIPLSTHHIVLTYRSQFALRLSLAIDAGGGHFIQLSDWATKMASKTKFHSLPAFSKFYESLQDAFQMDIEADTWPGVTVSQFIQLTQVPESGVSPLESYMGGALLFITACSILLGNPTAVLHTPNPAVREWRAGGAQGSGISVHCPPGTIGGWPRRLSCTVRLAGVRTGVELPVWRLGISLEAPIPKPVLAPAVTPGQPVPQNVQTKEWKDLASVISIMTQYFDQRVSEAPFHTSALTSYLRLLSLPPTCLSDLSLLMSWDLDPSLEPTHHHHSVRLVLIDALLFPGQPTVTYHNPAIITAPAAGSSAAPTIVTRTHDIHLQFNISMRHTQSPPYYPICISYNLEGNTIGFVKPIGLNNCRWRLRRHHLQVLVDLRKLCHEKFANALAGSNNRGVSPFSHYITLVATKPLNGLQ